MVYYMYETHVDNCNRSTMRGLIIVFVAFVIFQQTSLSWACDNGFTRFEDSCYRISHDKETWIGSEYTCRLESGNLAQIDSARENGFLQQLMKSHGAIQAWIAASDIDTEGDWLWWPDHTRPTYTNWGHGEPSNSGGAENCGLLGNNGLWNDGTCNVNLLYICEKPYSTETLVG